MPRPVPPDPVAPAARLSALGLAPGGWVPGSRDDQDPEWWSAADPPVATTPVGAVRPAHPPGGHADQPPPPRRNLADLAAHPWLDRVRLAPNGGGLAGLGLVCALVVLVLAVVLLRPHGAPAPAAVAPPVSATAVMPPAPLGIVVDVGGRVRHPGLVTLPVGSRVADALRAAGGALRAKDLVTLDLAARVVDGQLLLVGVPGAAALGTATAGALGSGAAPVALNTATLEQLEALPGVGPVLAQHILDWRERNGGFHSVDDLKDVAGIGARKFADLQPLVTL